MDWTHMAPTVLAAFLGSLVEFVEALTVILAVGVVRGWRGAIGGSLVALAVLMLLVGVLGPAISRIPQGALHFALGLLLLLFGMRWLRKAILRAAGVIPLHDEAAAYAKNSAEMRARGGVAARWDSVALSTSFNITMVEGIEVVFIVIAMGGASQGLLIPASLGAMAALAVVVLLGFALHRPVAAIPENALKFTIGVMLCGFGTFWAGEGMGIAWPARDLALVALNAGFLGVALALVLVCRAVKPLQRPALHSPFAARSGRLRSAVSCAFGLFVDEKSSAMAILFCLAACWWMLLRTGPASLWPPAILVIGLLTNLTQSALRRART